ncbi:hypothetical protein [Sandaracinus amylolyticus]|uniref:Uncharacterized protein n=1 Tax=Sandaracinus amylolyticus TaxID=927083 RepID=A0A0F6W8Z3_9BACT|nr:hypothetical protein [Sandaracinus amylolyticus]AKF10506.1 hypothetical protein DB32_007655 [Sandaracinus amylolyticus]
MTVESAILLLPWIALVALDRRALAGDVELSTLIEPIAARPVPGEYRTSIAYYRAVLALRAKDARSARALLDAVPRPLPRKRHAEAFEYLGALLDVVEGATERTLASAAAHEHGPRRASWLAVRAHAQAASGDVESARATLRMLRALRDPQLDLASVARWELPASRLASELMRGEEHPFR